MGSPKTPKTTTAASLPDPDPSPTITSDSSAEVQGARREAKKRAAATYGRQNTLLAGNAATNEAKKTILGG